MTLSEAKRILYQLGFDEGVIAGRKQVLDERQEEQKKFLQGFSYRPKGKD